MLHFSRRKTHVFSDHSDNWSSKTIYQQDFLKFDTAPAPLRIRSPDRRNKPQPTSASFNWKNARSLCEPVCFVSTKRAKNEQANWWPENVPTEETPDKPSYSLDSTSRFDYRPIDIVSFEKSRHEENRRFVDIQSRATSRERVSFEHQYNSRLPSNQPERGKLHGSFINEEAYPWIPRLWLG